MDEEEKLSEIFGEVWRDKYVVKWCNLCDRAIISCKLCLGSTCNGGGCDQCRDDFNEFRTYKTCVENYLTEDEKKIYEKALRIRRHIIETTRRGEKIIDWKKLQKNGELSEHEEKMFAKELA